MVVKINKKPMRVEKKEGEGMDWGLIGLQGIGSLAFLWFMDEVARMFFGTSPFPWMHVLGQFIKGVIGWFS